VSSECCQVWLPLSFQGGTRFYKSVQLLTYADDIDIIARFQTALKEAFLSLERAAGEMGLRINEKKTS